MNNLKIPSPPLTKILQQLLYNSEVNWSINTTIERSNNNLKCRKISQIVLLVTGITMIGYGAVRGEAAVVLGKAIKLCLECVGIG